jgi:S1-C subfamily serine protease
MVDRKYALALILVAGFIAEAATAQNAATGTAEQKAARAEIEQLTQRIEQLSKQLGPDSNLKITIVERSGDDANRTVERRVISSAPGGKTMTWSEDGPGRPDADRAPRIGLGIVMAPNADSNGVKVAAVSPNGPAKTAGIQSGDIITAINGKTVSARNQAGLEQARAALAKLKDGQSVKVAYTRSGKAATATVKAAPIEPRMVINRDTRRSGPGMAPPAMVHATRWNGLNMASLNPDLGAYFGTTNGVLVLSPNAGMPQLKGGDIISKVGGRAVNSPRDVLNAMRPKKAGDKVSLDILRMRKAQTVSITVPKERAFNIPAPPAPPAPQSVPDVPAPPAPPAPPRSALFLDEDGESYAFFEETFSGPADSFGTDGGHEIEIIEWRSVGEP